MATKIINPPDNPIYIKEFFDFGTHNVSEFESYINGANKWNLPIGRLEIHSVQYGVTDNKHNTTLNGISGILLMHYAPGTVTEIDEDLINVNIKSDESIHQVQIIQDTECKSVSVTEGNPIKVGYYYNDTVDFLRYAAGLIGNPIENTQSRIETRELFITFRDENTPIPTLSEGEGESDGQRGNEITVSADGELFGINVFDLSKRCVLIIERQDINTETPVLYEHISTISTDKNHLISTYFPIQYGKYRFTLKIIEPGCTKFNFEINKIIILK